MNKEKFAEEFYRQVDEYVLESGIKLNKISEFSGCTNLYNLRSRMHMPSLKSLYYFIGIVSDDFLFKYLIELGNVESNVKDELIDKILFELEPSNEIKKNIKLKRRIKREINNDKKI